MREESKEHRSYVMSKVPSKGTKPEIIVRKYLFSKGFRYRINDKRLPGAPDIVLPKYRTAIFVHGCFWHGHKGCKNNRTAKTNTEFWAAKITRNQERDQIVWRQLEAKGWYVVIVWECQLGKAVKEENLSRVASEITYNGEQYQKAQEERKIARVTYQKCLKEKITRENKLKDELKEVFPEY